MNENEKPTNRKNGWEILWTVLKTILTLGMNHLWYFLKNRK